MSLSLNLSKIFTEFSAGLNWQSIMLLLIQMGILTSPSNRVPANWYLEFRKLCSIITNRYEMLHFCISSMNLKTLTYPNNNTLIL